MIKGCDFGRSVLELYSPGEGILRKSAQNGPEIEKNQRHRPQVRASTSSRQRLARCGETSQSYGSHLRP